MARYNGGVLHTPDEVLTRIAEAAAMGRLGERERARRVLQEIWDEIKNDGEALHRLALAHAMADVQDELPNELMWDLRALEAAGGVADEHLCAAGSAGSARGLYPSLHLNLADVYQRLGERHRANEQIFFARRAVDELNQDTLHFIQEALDRVERRLDAR